jgi:hypothetical protein
VHIAVDGLTDMLPQLGDILNFTNERIFTRYQKDYPKNRMPAAEAMYNLLKYMWLCQKHHLDRYARKGDTSLQFSCVMHAEMSEFDDMWHTFLLFTREYHEFCQHYFGDFFHHHPLTDEEKDITREEQERELTHYLSYVYDNLGEETVRVWFDEC